MAAASSSDFVIALAKTAAERAQFEALRKQAFPPEQSMPRDPLDDVCDYLLIKDGDILAAGCRLVRVEHAARVGGFYTAGEFDIGDFLRNEPNPLEIGRFCTSTDYRQGGNIFRMFWRHLTLYIRRHRITSLFGCASFPGQEPNDLGAEFNWLRQNRLLQAGLVKVKAGSRHFLLSELEDAEFVDKTEGELVFPPLVKVYLNMGGRVADVGFIDRDFDCIDLCLVVRVGAVPERYTKT